MLPPRGLSCLKSGVFGPEIASVKGFSHHIQDTRAGTSNWNRQGYIWLVNLKEPFYGFWPDLVDLYLLRTQAHVNNHLAVPADHREAFSLCGLKQYYISVVTAFRYLI